MKKAQLVVLMVGATMFLASCDSRTDVDISDSADLTEMPSEAVVTGGNPSDLVVQTSRSDVDEEILLRVVSSVNSIMTGGNEVAVLTVVATDTDNNAIPGTAISYSSTGGVLQNIEPATNANGEARATLNLPQDFQNRDIVVTASVNDGASESSIIISTVGSSINVVGPESMVEGDDAPILAVLTAGNGKAIANQPVSVTSESGIPVITTPLVTDADGRVSFTVDSEDTSEPLIVSALQDTATSTYVFAFSEELLGQPDADDEMKLRVVSDVNSIVTGGTEVATITVLATDSSNNAISGANISYSSTSGVLQNIVSITDDNGEASATLKLPQDFQNQDIIVTASTNNGESESAVKITTSGSSLNVSGPDSLVAGDSAELVVRLTAGNGEPIANQTVRVTSSAGNTVTPSELATDSDGRVDFTVGSDNSTDTIRITALNESVFATHVVTVVDDLLSFVEIVDGTEFEVGEELSDDNVVKVNWTSQGSPLANQTLNFSITAGLVEPSTAVTDAFGNVEVLIGSNSAGPAKITVEAADGGPKIDIDVEFVATVPADVLIDASSSLVNIGETSSITALVKDALGNPVKNSDVSFTSDDLKGGQLNPASAMTNSAGIATVTFTAGANPTVENAIQIKATVKGTAIHDEMNLTVFKRALNITMGSTNLIEIKPLRTQYAMPMVVQVADGSGTPLENATVKLSLRPISYGKGVMVLYDKDNRNLAEALAEGDDFIPVAWGFARNTITCPAEDRNGDRIMNVLDPADHISYTLDQSNTTTVVQDPDDEVVGDLQFLISTEDTNNNGSLDPQDPASLAAIEGPYATLSSGSLRTDKNGSGYFELLYPASNSGWASVEIIARAEALGAEAIDSFPTRLLASTEELTTPKQIPAGYISPYGTDAIPIPADGVITSDVINAQVIGSSDVNGTVMTVYRGCTTTQ